MMAADLPSTPLAAPDAPFHVAGVLAAGGAPRRVAPQEARIGHVHLGAADLAAAAQPDEGGFGMAVIHRRPGAARFGARDYHHHLAANPWSGPLRPRRQGEPGLEAMALAARDDATRARLAAALASAAWRNLTGVGVTLA